MVAHASGIAPARMVATLSDSEIRRVRIGVELTTGLTAAIVGVAKLSTMAEHTGAWDRANAFAYLGTATMCLTAVALTRTRWQGAAEVAVLLAAFLVWKMETDGTCQLFPPIGAVPAEARSAE